MKARLLILAGPLFALAAAASAEQAPPTNVPGSFPADRYQKMVEHSPFALATAATPPPAPPEAGFAADWYVTGLSRIDGQDFVSIRSKDLDVQMTLFGDRENNGVKLLNVSWSPMIGKSTVTIEKDGQTARIGFNEMELQAFANAAPATVQRPNLGQSGGPNGPRGNRIPGQIPRPGPGGGAVSQPSSYPVTPSTITPNVGGAAPAVPPPAANARRRIRLINSGGE